MKNQRQLKILEIINHTNVETQEELLALLRHEGFAATQATISRDIKELHLHKTPLANGSYKYAISNTTIQDADERMRYRNVLREVIISAVAAGNLVVVKTLSGTANAAAAALESMGYSELLGTLAGDDTLLCVFPTDKAAFDYSSKINSLFIKE